MVPANPTYALSECYDTEGRERAGPLPFCRGAGHSTMVQEEAGCKCCKSCSERCV